MQLHQFKDLESLNKFLKSDTITIKKVKVLTIGKKNKPVYYVLVN